MSFSPAAPSLFTVLYFPFAYLTDFCNEISDSASLFHHHLSCHINALRNHQHSYIPTPQSRKGYHLISHTRQHVNTSHFFLSCPISPQPISKYHLSCLVEISATIITIHSTGAFVSRTAIIATFAFAQPTKLQAI